MIKVYCLVPSDNCILNNDWIRLEVNRLGTYPIAWSTQPSIPPA